jgi:hypothetical protein
VSQNSSSDDFSKRCARNNVYRIFQYTNSRILRFTSHPSIVSERTLLYVSGNSRNSPILTFNPLELQISSKVIPWNLPNNRQHVATHKGHSEMSGRNDQWCPSEDREREVQKSERQQGPAPELGAPGLNDHD